MRPTFFRVNSERAGFHDLLRLPKTYAALQSWIVSPDSKEYLAASHYENLLSSAGHILDFGCGPGTLLATYPQVNPKRFVGLDTNLRYIVDARGRFPEATFIHIDSPLADLAIPALRYDFCVMSGVLHHLSDDAARTALALVHEKLDSGGDLLTIDPTWRRHPVAKSLMLADRGRFVRHADHYRSLIESIFGPDRCDVRIETGLLRVPYRHCLTRSRKA